MTEEEIDQFETDLECALFHVMSDDKHDDSGASLEEVILIRLLAINPKVLAHKPLKYWVDRVVGKCYKK